MMMETVLSRSIRLMFAGGIAMGLGLSGAAQAQEAAATTTQRVEVTGSSIKRIAAESSLPVTVIKREDIARTGATTAQDLVNLIPSNFGGSVAAQNVGATGVPSTANLRSLGSQYTLVLLNGRRIANYAFGDSPVDLNSIPLAAIERIEVLRDGASALYGADAVAGVINFILRKDFQGVEVSAYQTFVNHSGGGNQTSFNFTGGIGDLNVQGFNFLLSAGRENDQALKARDRSFANSAVVPALGINKASPRNGVPNFTFTDTNGVKHSGVNPLRFGGCNSDEFSLVIRDANTCGTDYVKYIDLLPKATHDNIVARAVFRVNPDNDIYVEGVKTQDDSKATYSPAPYTKQMKYPIGGRFYPTSFLLPDGTTVTPASAMTGTWRTVAGGGRTDLTTIDNERFTVGIKGTIAGFDYDTAIIHSINEGAISFGPGQFSFAKLTPLVNAGQINVFGSQDAVSQAALDSARLFGQENTAISKSTELDFHASKEIYQMPYGALGLGFGANARKESLEQISFPVLASGDQVGGAGPIPGVVGSRKVYGVFAELSIPVYNKLDVNVAARYDNYKTDFNTSFSKLSPKISVRFEPIKEMVLRASAGTGYRAPTLYQNLRPLTTGNNTASNFSDPIRCPGGVAVTGPNITNPVGDFQDECNVQLPTALSGNPDLKPEKSNQYSLGVVFQLTNNFSGSIDYFDVKVKDAIQQLSENTVFGDPAGNVQYFYRFDPTKVDAAGNPTQLFQGSTDPNLPLAYVLLPYANTAKFFAAGFDVNLKYQQKFASFGSLGANLDATIFTKHGYQYAGLDTVSDLGNYKDFGPTPRYRHALTFTYANGPWGGSLTHNLTSSYTDFTNPASVGKVNYPAERTVSKYQTIDGTIAYRGFQNTSIVFGVKNLFDQDPPLSRTEANFQTGYDSTFTNPLGRTYYVRASYKF